MITFQQDISYCSHFNILKSWNNILNLISVQRSHKWQRYHLNRSSFTFDSFVNLPQLSSELVNLQFAKRSLFSEIFFCHLDRVLQRLSKKVVIVCDLEIQISGRGKQTLNCLLYTRSFAVGHSNEAVHIIYVIHVMTNTKLQIWKNTAGK